MKYLRGKVCLFSLVLLLQAVVPYASQAEEYSKTFEAELFENNRIYIKLVGDKYLYRFGEVEWRVLKAGVIEGGGGKEVILMDVNKNHINDVFVKLFESGANNIYALFIASKKDGAVVFSEYEELFGSPYINDRGELTSVKRDGPFSVIETYMIEQGELHRNQTREPINSDLEKVTNFNRQGKEEFSIKFLGTNISANACVDASRAYLSNSPSAADVTKAYIVKGDRVSILDSANNGEWFKVRYHGGHITDGWLSQAMLSFQGAAECMRD
ncbi:SH3 domain-containing protein [Pseudomonas sp. Leaf48]|uniref:SH3 domain-containing protein n=1 Tax=Pseudomonas sp. Leaf48 TaxID=1736221 RepID=UPI0012E83AEE|nr:SH3 domain-containing protein [Pseudomonas sp. Leaf48]